MILLIILALISPSAGSQYRIIGGRPAQPHQFPFQVSLKRSYSGAHFCSGSILDSQHVITAAHCLFYRWGGVLAETLITVHAGQNYLNSPESVGRNISTIFIHPLFNKKSLANDLAIIRLTTILPIDGKSIATIRISSDRLNINTCTISGWGSDNFSATSNLLLSAEVNIVDFTECQRKYQKANITLPEGALCAGNDATPADACTGDSGGPLICNGNLVGIVSSGRGCGDKNYPGIYVNLQKYISWIRSFISPEIIPSRAQFPSLLQCIISYLKNMALYDNKYWLLSHIRNSFISTDDTGTCELIMASEDGVRKHLKQQFDYYPDEDDSEDDDDDDDDISHESYDLQLDMDFVVRCRSNTVARLEKLEQAKKKNSRMKHIKWEMSKTPIPQERLDEIFIKRDINKLLNDKKKKSLFSTMFQQYTKLPTNPYIEYAKFDGSGQVNVAIKKYRIFLTMLPENQRNYPLSIACIISAKIQDLIGLILLKCSTNYDDYQWKPIVHYGLYITEEDGEVDRDFPCLDARENIGKFGFTCLGLVEHNDPAKFVTFDQCETIAIAKPLEDDTDKKSREQSKVDQERQISTDLQLMDIHNKEMEAPLYKSYRVYMVNKLSKVEIHLGISGEKIEIDPVQQNSKFTLVKQKPISHHMDTIACCEIIDTKTSKTVFKIVYTHSYNFSNDNVSASPLKASTSFKHYEFEADHKTAQEIVDKIELILKLRSSEIRKEFIAKEERKLYKKQLLTLSNKHK